MGIHFKCTSTSFQFCQNVQSSIFFTSYSALILWGAHSYRQLLYVFKYCPAVYLLPPLKSGLSSPCCFQCNTLITLIPLAQRELQMWSQWPVSCPFIRGLVTISPEPVAERDSLKRSQWHITCPYIDSVILSTE